MKLKLLFASMFLIIAGYAQDLEELTITEKLNSGWNQLGYPESIPLPVDVALSQIWDKVEIIKNADGFYQIRQEHLFNTLDTLKTGDGFFVKVNEACEIEWTVLRYNYAPEKPIAMFPENGMSDVNTSIQLLWNSADRENEALSYTILLDGNPTPTTVLASSYSLESLEVPNLNFETTYYWQVEVQDAFGHTVKSEVFEFETMQIPDTGTVVDVDGNEYPWKRYGDQTWMTVNLRTTRYADGTPIPHVPKDSDWSSLAETGKAYCFYDTTGTGYTEYSQENFGALYTWAAAVNGNTDTVGVQGACPEGWHIPSDEEWTQFERYIAENGYAYDDTQYDGTESDEEARSKIAKAITTNWGWTSDVVTGAVGNTDMPEKQNDSKFNGVPAGYRGVNGPILGIGNLFHWWSSTAYSETHAWYRYYNYSLAYVYRSKHYVKQGFSVRCVKDE